MQVTFEEYDDLCEMYQAMPFQAGDWLPTEEDLQLYVQSNPEPFIPFLIWISETGNVPKNLLDKSKRKMIQQILYQNLQIGEK